MGELLQLDAAAKLVGKSEVTLRRLVKAGKVTAHKEKTLTGFIYRVDSDEIRAYYQIKEEAFAHALHEPAPAVQEEPVPEPKTGHAITSNGKIRIAIANESGNSAEYWLKRAEIYEERYHREVQRAGQMREELGIWRGRAEHAQAMLMKMLPAPQTIEISRNNQRGDNQSSESENGMLFPILIFVVVLLIAGIVIYILTSK